MHIMIYSPYYIRKYEEPLRLCRQVSVTLKILTTAFWSEEIDVLR